MRPCQLETNEGLKGKEEGDWRERESYVRWLKKREEKRKKAWTTAFSQKKSR